MLAISQLVGWTFQRAFQLAFHVIGQGGVIALDAGRTLAFEHVKDMLELKEHRSGRGAGQAKTAQVFQLRRHVHQWGIKSRAEQAQIMMAKCGSVEGVEVLPRISCFSSKENKLLAQSLG